MRSLNSAYLIVLLTSSAFAQNAMDKPGAASAQELQGNAMQGSESMKEMGGDAAVNKGMHSGGANSAKHRQHMKEAQSNLNALHANLEKMKAQVGQALDPTRKTELQLNADMWQALLNGMEKHLAQMKSMMEAKHDRMPHHADDGKHAASRNSGAMTP